jgi:hypothetical protein
MTADVPGEVDADLPVGAAPLPGGPHEAVAVAACRDGLQWQTGQGLQHGEVRARDRRAGVLIDLDRDIGGHVLRAWRAVVVDDHHVVEHFLDGGLATDRAAAASEGGLGEQGAEAGEVARRRRVRRRPR